MRPWPCDVLPAWLPQATLRIRQAQSSSARLRSGLEPRPFQLLGQGRGVVWFSDSRRAAESLRQIGRTVSGHENERNSLRQQIVGQRVHHLAVEIRIQNSQINYLAMGGLRRFRKIAERADDRTACGLQEVFELDRQ